MELFVLDTTENYGFSYNQIMSSIERCDTTLDIVATLQ